MDNETIVDSTGRKITVKKLTVLDQTRLLRAIGAEQSTNQPYVSTVWAAAQAVDIDGVPMPRPLNERQIDAMIDRLGDAGMAALLAKMMREVAESTEAADRALDGAAPASPLPTPA